MKLIYLDSTAIFAVAYENGTLRVVFQRGGVYDHPGVPEWVFHEFINADSHGGYYNHFIRGRY